jgi:hypothetical protein
MAEINKIFFEMSNFFFWEKLEIQNSKFHFQQLESFYNLLSWFQMFFGAQTLIVNLKLGGFQHYKKSK